MGSALELRIILAVIAVVIIIALYVWYRTNSKPQISDNIEDLDLTKELDEFLLANDEDEDEQEHLPEDLRSEFQGVSKQLREEKINQRLQEAKLKQSRPNTKQVRAGEAVEDDTKEMLVVFHVVARDDEQFTGSMIKMMMSELGLEYGDMGVFHFNVERFDKKHSVYCVANMLKPGSFDLAQMDTLATRGLSFILQLPGPEDSLKAYNIMVEHAQRIATFFNGELLDQDRNIVTNQALSLYKEQVQLFGLRALEKTITM